MKKINISDAKQIYMCSNSIKKLSHITDVVSVGNELIFFVKIKHINEIEVYINEYRDREFIGSFEPIDYRQFDDEYDEFDNYKDSNYQVHETAPNEIKGIIDRYINARTPIGDCYLMGQSPCGYCDEWGLMPCHGFL